MKKITALEDEFIYTETLTSGLRIAIHPKAEFQNTLVTLQINFGGACLGYRIDNQIKKIPAGVAHFLEHIMFHNNQFNLPKRFAESGADINAYTSKSITAYQFKTINHIDELLKSFMNNFIGFCMSEEVIAKEREIIVHEIMMSDDSIHFDMHQKLMRMMYSDYSIHSDVGGTIKDIKQINHQMLEETFNTFYHPENSTLIITGNVDPEAIMKQLREHAYNKKQWPAFPNIQPTIIHKPRRIHHTQKRTTEIEEPMITYAVRIPNHFIAASNREFLHIALSSIVANVFGLGSQTFDYLEKNKLMNVSFFTKLTLERTYGYIKIFIQTNKVKRYKETISKIIEDISEKPLDKEFFTINKRNIMGNYITLFDSLSQVHDLLCNTMIESVQVDDYLEHIMTHSIEDLTPYKKIFVPENIYSITYLKAKKNK